MSTVTSIDNLLHNLRNPFGRSKTLVNADRLEAADRLESFCNAQKKTEEAKPSTSSCTNCGDPKCSMKAGWCGKWVPCKTSGN